MERPIIFRSINPATDEVIASYPALTASELENRLARAATAYRHWRISCLDERTALLYRLADSYERNKGLLARMATDEMGKTLASAQAEVEKCISAFRHYATHGPAMLAPQTVPISDKQKAMLQWQSIGPILAVMPWNFPYWQVVRFLAPALLAGNVGLLKHASNVQGVAGLLEAMMEEAGAPDALFQNLAVKSDMVADIIADQRIAAVTLTGSEGAGVAVAEQAGRNLKKVVLELGGSDPFIIMPSADLSSAVPQAVKARIQNTGQSCICGKRMIVHAAIYDKFLDQFTAAMTAVKAGDPLDPTTDMGPLSSQTQRATVQQQLDQARKYGAQLIGGKILAGKGAYMAAGILTGLPAGSPFMTEELFGPIAIVQRATDIDDAVRIANAIPYGLGASVWTQSANEQERFVRDIESGMIAINQILASTPEAPFGGIKRSGYGRELGPYGLHEFMNLKTVLQAV